MARERIFYTGSTRIISDASITATEHRIYACVSLHDGMSLLKAKGAGCYASNQKLAARVGCDYSTLCKGLSRLVAAGYLVKGVSGDDRRMTVYRVTFPDEKEWRAHHPNDQQLGGEDASSTPEIGGEDNSENLENPPETAEHYIPLKVELDSVETEEIDSDESARFANTALGKTKFSENDGAQMARFEREWKDRPTTFTDEQLVEWHEWLSKIAEYDLEYLGDPLTGRAQRLLDDMDLALWERKIGPYAEDDEPVTAAELAALRQSIGRAAGEAA